MSNKNTSLKLSYLVEKLGLKTVYVPGGGSENCDDIDIITSEVNRPGLALTGYFTDFEKDRLQLMGNAEHGYLESLTPDDRKAKVDALFSRKFPALIICQGIKAIPEITESAKKYEIPLLGTEEPTSNVMSSVISLLSVKLAPQVTRHGVLVEVYGEGILMLGESGVGKSEAAMELLKRGHRLVADDAVEIKRVSNRTLVGTSPEIIRHLIELRGIGIVDVRQIFGMGAVKESEKIDLVLSLENWSQDTKYDRFGLEYEQYDILGLQVPMITIPIKPGRNLAVIIEVAAMNNRLKRLGYNAAAELNKRLEASMNDND
jgi:HPr serine kinase N terminus